MKVAPPSPIGWLLLGLLAASCGADKGTPPEAVRSDLGGGAVARVEGRDIASSTVRDIAQGQGIDVRKAVDRAVFDALVAREAESRGLEGAEARNLSRARVRPLLAMLADEARALGPPTDEELGVSVRRDWFKVARPAAVVTVHAVVQLEPGADEAAWERATKLAAAIRAAVVPVAEAARDSDGPALEFDERGNLPGDPAADRFILEAKRVPFGEFDGVDAKGSPRVVVQILEPVAADNGTVLPTGRSGYDPEFVRAAVALARRGDLSPPSRSSVGVHVILALGWMKASELSDQEIVARYEDEVIDRRSRTKVDALVARLEKEVPVEQDRTVDQLLELVQVSK